jgi:DNA-binding MarR family transcriptional regulator
MSGLDYTDVDYAIADLMIVAALGECYPYGMTFDELRELTELPHAQTLSGSLRRLEGRGLLERDRVTMLGGRRLQPWVWATPATARVWGMITA